MRLPPIKIGLSSLKGDLFKRVEITRFATFILANHEQEILYSKGTLILSAYQTRTQVSASF